MQEKRDRCAGVLQDPQELDGYISVHPDRGATRHRRRRGREAPDASDSVVALNRLNGLIDQWALERLTIYVITRTTHTIVASTATYSIGASGDIAIARPPSAEAIEHINLVETADDPDTETSLKVLTEDEYAGWMHKAETDVAPTHWYYSPTWPNGTLYLLPIPTTSTLQITLYVPTALSEAAASTTTFTLPPGYERFMRTNLALELSSAFEKAPEPWLIQAARQSKQAIQVRNLRMQDWTPQRRRFCSVVADDATTS